MRRLTGLALLALVVAPAAGCIRMYNARSEIRADPLTVERHAEAVFTSYLIPVAERAANNRVESGWFVAGDVWGGDAIRVNAVAPGLVEGTEGARRLAESIGYVDAYRRQVPLGRLAAPADRHEVPARVGERQQALPPPQVRDGLGPRVLGHQVADLGPERDQPFLLEAPVQVGERALLIGAKEVADRDVRSFFERDIVALHRGCHNFSAPDFTGQ